MVSPRSHLSFLGLVLLTLSLFGQNQTRAKPRPHVIVVGVNGMELDVLRPLLLKGDLPNLARVIKNGAYGKLRTVDAPNCPRVYSTCSPALRRPSTALLDFWSAESPLIPIC